MTTLQHHWIDRLCEHGFRILDIGPTTDALAYTKKGKVWYMSVSVSGVSVRRAGVLELAYNRGWLTCLQ